MILFRRTEYEKPSEFESEDKLREFLYNDYKKAWNGYVPFERENVVAQKEKDRVKVGLTKFGKAVYDNQPLWIGYYTVK